MISPGPRRLIVDPDVYQQVGTRLDILRSRWAAHRGGVPAQHEVDLDAATESEIFDILDNELGLA